MALEGGGCASDDSEALATSSVKVSTSSGQVEPQDVCDLRLPPVARL